MSWRSQVESPHGRPFDAALKACGYWKAAAVDVGCQDGVERPCGYWNFQLANGSPHEDEGGNTCVGRIWPETCSLAFRFFASDCRRLRLSRSLLQRASQPTWTTACSPR